MANYNTIGVITAPVKLNDDLIGRLEGTGATCDLFEGKYHVYWDEYLQENWENGEENLWDLLHDIMVYGGLDLLSAQFSFTCSSMRPDGFGGLCFIVTKLGYVSVCTTDFDVDDKGVATINVHTGTWS